MSPLTIADARAVAETVVDPELPMLTLHDLGVLRDVRGEGGAVVVDLVPTYSGCPAMAEMRADVAHRLHAAGYRDVQVRVVLAPPWTTDDISEHGLAVLAEHGIAPPGPAARRGAGPVPLTLGTPPSRLDCPRCGSRETHRLSQFGSTPCKALYRCGTCAEPFEHLKAI